MSTDPAAFWRPDTSVFFTSFWGWAPETWAALGWTGKRGEGRRRNLMDELSDPFVAVIYVTSHSDNEQELRGRIAGFYLVSHEEGDRDEFIHPKHFDLDPDKWRHSLRANRAFTYLPEHRLTVPDLDPTLLDRAQSVAGMGTIITDPAQIRLLKQTPWVEVDVYQSPGAKTLHEDEMSPTRGFSRAGPANREGYVVSTSAQELQRQLYVLRLDGDTSAYLGQPSKGRFIFKIGLSVSPSMRRDTFKSLMPRGAFEWTLFRASGSGDLKTIVSFDAAVAGEYAMKLHLSEYAEWLGGEFYLADEAVILNAWQLGLKAARTY